MRVARMGRVLLLVSMGVLAGCAASRSSLHGRFEGAPRPPSPSPQEVSVAFLFTHVHQQRGWDVIPKLHHQDRYANGFYDFFGNALPLLSGIGSYSTFTDRAEDVTDPGRRALRDSLAQGSHDFTVAMRFARDTSFPREALGTIASVLTLTAVPVPYTRRYSVAAEVTDRSGRLLKRYEREATVTLWVEALLIFAYPFHPETRKTDEVYLEFLRDVFREMESDRVLRRAGDSQAPPLRTVGTH